MSWALKVEGLHKVFCHYNRPLDRLKELATFGLRTYHDELVALEDINIEIEAGSTVGIIGRNGAGKSTLLKIVSGNLGQTSGKVQVRGRLSSILELGIGFQPGLTGRQNIRINALLLGMRPDEIERCIPEVAEFSEIGAAVDRPISTYSSGMQARLAFSILTAVKADVIVLDEALAAGDVGFVAKSNNLIQQFSESGSTVLVVSHDMRVIRQVCDRAIWLDQGKLMADGDAEAVVEKYLRAVPELAAQFAPPKPPPEELTSIPIRLPLRFRRTDDGVEPLSYPIDRIEYVEAETGVVLGRGRPQQDSHYVEFIRGARSVGLSRDQAERGWGDVEIVSGAPMRLFQVAGGQSFVLSPFAPQVGQPGPVELHVIYRDTQSTPLQVDLLHDGEWSPLGQVFGAGDGERRCGVFRFPDSCRFDTMTPPEVEPEAEAAAEPATVPAHPEPQAVSEGES